MAPPFFESGRTRKINLGGSTSTSTHASILDSVKARRHAKLDAQRRTESAVQIQSWYRGRSQAKKIRAQLRESFDLGQGGIEWTRCLVAACGSEDQDRLGRWSSIMKDRGDYTLSTSIDPINFDEIQRRSLHLSTRQNELPG